MTHIKQKNGIFILVIILLTILAFSIPILFPDFSKAPNDRFVKFNFQNVLIFLMADLILIGIPAWLHRVYVKDYKRIKNIWFFVLFGTISGVLLGENFNLIMIIPYAILMLIYAFLYKKFVWWKVASTTYLAGLIIENIMNRAPLQASTLIWVPFFIYPYFLTKIFENKKKAIFMIKDSKYPLVSSIILGGIGIYLGIILPGKFSPPLIFLAFILPFLIKILYNLIRR